MKPDIRIRHTKENIRKSFFTLLSQKEFCQITVTDICNLAEINRSTFYKHYLDIIDLLEQTENEILDKIRKLWKKLHPKNTIEGMESILSETQSTMWDSAFYIFKADPDFSYKITEIICHDSCVSFLNDSSYSVQERNMLNRFIVYGCGSITRNWLLSDSNEKLSPHELAEFLYHLIEKMTE
ncbi:hypothetical protein IMSAG249_02296 [Lachnospiraceae bacterium]|jgi:AcrR family transcriptional regulator|nr:TetR/AcrR family transcriptional regulator [Candidatus Galacturonibacter soehngenii]NBH29194.1 TetR/AcrR family transcriptional regulator [Lachnospiraceae bacterium]GFI70467.1 hypothetical protein IMSAG249_02296 [Lachnospiraceae bacterium]